MHIEILSTTSSSITYELCINKIYDAPSIEVKIYKAEKLIQTTNTTKIINTFYNLEKDSEYKIVAEFNSNQLIKENIKTDFSKHTLDVRDFGAKGDGKQNATPFIQAAINVAPKNCRIIIPEGTYLINSLFLKSNIEFEICKNANLIADTNKTHYPFFPDMVEDYNNNDFEYLGSWEGNPYKAYCSIINAINVENVKIFGEGTINGQASFENWWKDPKHKENHIARPRLFFANHTNNILIEGLKFTNSPSWTIHPLNSKNVKIINTKILNPEISPNTDGIDPESCENLSIIGVHFSLGDDCIAIKSGKIFIANHKGLPSSKITIRQCLMENGHGAVTLGSELACGIYDVLVEDCKFKNTDRGLRIKTRRGRGERAIIDNIIFNKIKMDGVKIPFVINSYYFCDIDGHSNYVQTREKLPIDSRTPNIKSLTFSNIEAINCEIAVASIEGLSEKPINKISFKNIEVNFKQEAKEAFAAMNDKAIPIKKRGFIIENVNQIEMNNIKISNYEGPKVLINGKENEELF